ncbi:hypothetical protein R6Q57_021244 [Mikania cordata]
MNSGTGISGDDISGDLSPLEMATRLYDAIGMKPSSQTESMSKSKHDHVVDGGYATASEPVAVDQNYISWMASNFTLFILITFRHQVLHACMH